MCKDCSAARQTNGASRLYNSPGCVYCTARLIRAIGRQPYPKDQLTKRRQVVLADAIAFGHDEKEIRALAALKELIHDQMEGKRK